MSRPRIRTLKPELWADEKVGRLSRDARLLMVGLITMADDEGRLRALPAAILGHAFPYDRDAPKHLDRWIGELVEAGIVVAYEHDGTPYMAFPSWSRHQRINRPSESLLPSPVHGTFSEPVAVLSSVSVRSFITPVRARGSDQGSDRIGSEGIGSNNSVGVAAVVPPTTASAA